MRNGRRIADRSELFMCPAAAVVVGGAHMCYTLVVIGS